MGSEMCIRDSNNYYYYYYCFYYYSYFFYYYSYYYSYATSSPHPKAAEATKESAHNVATSSHRSILGFASAWNTLGLKARAQHRKSLIWIVVLQHIVIVGNTGFCTLKTWTLLHCVGKSQYFQIPDATV